MNNKIPIGSIIAISILIGVSFTSVVGYRSVDSDVKASPLFNIRTSRAIDEENNIVTSEYVGKGDVINLSIPTRDNNIEAFQKFIDLISYIDDVKFNFFIRFIANNIQNNKRIRDKNIGSIETALIYFRNEPLKKSDYKIYPENNSEIILTTSPNTMCPDPTFCGDKCFTLSVTPYFCLLGFLIFLPIILPYLVLIAYESIKVSCWWPIIPRCE